MPSQPNDWQSTLQRRRGPASSTQLVATFASGGRLLDDVQSGPLRIDIEATDAEGELAPWFGDDWFADLIRRFGDEFLSVSIAPTRDALLHPCVVHESEMLRRVVPHWRIVATAYLSDVQTADAVRAVAACPYHEIRFFDETRPAAAVTTPDRIGIAWTMNDLFGRIRRVTQTATGRSPVLVRLPARDRSDAPADGLRVDDPHRSAVPARSSQRS